MYRGQCHETGYPQTQWRKRVPIESIPSKFKESASRPLKIGKKYWGTREAGKEPPQHPQRPPRGTKPPNKTPGPGEKAERKRGGAGAISRWRISTHDSKGSLESSKKKTPLQVN